MSGERDIDTLLAGLAPSLNPGAYVFVSASGPPAGAVPVAMVREAEGTTFVVEQADADAAGLDYDFVASWITLGVHSALDAVGLTGAVAARLAAADISCNVVAGRFHDHLFVPTDRAQDALELLESRG